MSSGRVPFSLIDLVKHDLLPAVPGHAPRQSCYKFNYVKGSHRAPDTPRTNRHFRMRHLHGLMAFYRNRFYEKDRWYKARIEKPILYPTCYFIDPYKLTKSLSERLAELNVKDSVLYEPVDIGFPLSVKVPDEPYFNLVARARQENSSELERAARHRQLRVDLDGVERDTLMDPTTGAPVLRQMAEHYGVFRDLFHPAAYFNPVVPLKVYYDHPTDADTMNPVLYGNTLAPKDTSKAPIVKYDAEPGSLWTLLLTNPDGNLFEDGKEIVHWLVTNIPENRVHDGETLVDYLQPVPPKGTGYHRLVFVLFRQDNGRVNLTDYQKSIPCHKLEERTFHTPTFYKKHEEEMTPGGLAFFQTSWDDSCSQCFHHTLNMEEPIYEYDWPQPYLPPQEEFPSENVAFNLYLDKYRDPKDIEKELLMKRLKRISPFVNDVADTNQIRRRRYFPNVFYDQDREQLPSWAHFQKIRENQGVGKYKAIYENRLE